MTGLFLDSKLTLQLFEKMKDHLELLIPSDSPEIKCQVFEAYLLRMAVSAGKTFFMQSVNLYDKTIQEKDFSHITLKVNNTNITVISAVACTLSNVAKTAFQTKMKESENSVLTCVETDDLDHSLLDLLFNKGLNGQEFERVLFADPYRSFRLTHFLSMPLVSAKLIKYIESQFYNGDCSVDETFSLWSFAATYDIPSLKVIAITKLLRADLSSLSPETVSLEFRSLLPALQDLYSVRNEFCLDVNNPFTLSFKRLDPRISYLTSSFNLLITTFRPSLEVISSDEMKNALLRNFNLFLNLKEILLPEKMIGLFSSFELPIVYKPIEIREPVKFSINDVSKLMGNIEIITSLTFSECSLSEKSTDEFVRCLSSLRCLEVLDFTNCLMVPEDIAKIAALLPLLPSLREVTILSPGIVLSKSAHWDALFEAIPHCPFLNTVRIPVNGFNLLHVNKKIEECKARHSTMIDFHLPFQMGSGGTLGRSPLFTGE